MADVLQEAGRLDAARDALRGNLVADAPHHHTRVVAIVAEHVDHVALRPCVEEPVVAVLTLGDIPLVERLQHHHESQLVAEPDQFGRRHVVRSADGIAAHVLEDAQLPADGRFVHGGAERAEVVVQADAFDLPALPVQFEAAFGGHGNAPDAENRLVPVDFLLILAQDGHGRV